MVMKKDGTREPFDRDKLKHGLWRACVKRRINERQIDEIVNDMEEDFGASSDVTTSQVGKAAMEKLRAIDPVAYVRFASVYQEFDSPESFKKILETL
jgi:transcriptional repressor NrdR